MKSLYQDNGIVSNLRALEVVFIRECSIFLALANPMAIGHMEN